MSEWKNNLLPPIHWPTIVKDTTLWTNGEAAKIHLDLSDRLFATLSDYDMFFAWLQWGSEILPQLATKEIKEYKKFKATFAHEIASLIDLIKASDHYKAAYTLAHPITDDDVSENTDTQQDDLIQKEETPTQTQAVVSQKDENTTDPLVQVILDAKDIELTKEQSKLLDKYYATIIKNLCTELSHFHFMIDGKSKKLSVHNPLPNGVSRLFATAKKKKVIDTTPIGIVVPEKPWFRTRIEQGIKELYAKISRVPNHSDKEDIIHDTIPFQKDIALFRIEHAWESIFVLLKFVSNGKKLMTEIEWDIVLEKNPLWYNTSIPLITIDHPDYVQTKMK